MLQRDENRLWYCDAAPSADVCYPLGFVALQSALVSSLPDAAGGVSPRRSPRAKLAPAPAMTRSPSLGGTASLAATAAATASSTGRSTSVPSLAPLLAETLYMLEVRSPLNDSGPVVLGASTEGERDRWVAALADTARSFDVNAEGHHAALWAQASTVQYPLHVAPTQAPSVEDVVLSERAALFRVQCAVDAEQCAVPLHVRVARVDNLPPMDKCQCYASVQCVYGRRVLRTVTTPTAAAPAWSQWLRIAGAVSELPLETWLVFSLIAFEDVHTYLIATRKVQHVYHAHVPLSNGFGQIRGGGALELRLWQGKAQASLGPNADASAPLMHVELESTPLPLVYPQSLPASWLLALPSVGPLQGQEQKQAVASDPHLCTEGALRTAWLARDQGSPADVPLQLAGCDWVREREHAHLYLEQRCRGTAATAVQLLDVCASTRARFVAMHMLAQARTAFRTLALFVVGTLVSEQHDWSPAVEVALRAAAASPDLVHCYFWALRSQASPARPMGSRFAALLRLLLQLTRFAGEGGR